MTHPVSRTPASAVADDVEAAQTSEEKEAASDSVKLTGQMEPKPSPEIREWCCQTCHGIWQCGKGERCSFCGGTSVVQFDLAKHGRLLIGQSNAWNYVWYRWKYHPLARAAARYNAMRNCHGASSTINRMITKLLEESEAPSVSDGGSPDAGRASLENPS